MARPSPDPAAAPGAGAAGRGGRLRGPGRRLMLVLAVGAGLAWWILVWASLQGTVLLRVPLLDEAFYLRQGAAIAGGELVPPGPFVMSPLYPYLVAGTGSGRLPDERGVLAGGPPVGIRLLQLALWAGTIVVLVLAARRLLPRRLRPLPALLFALYRPAAIYATAVLLEVPLTFLTALALHLLARRAGPARGGTAGEDGPAPGGGATGITPGEAVLVGALLGAGALLRFHLVLLLPVAWYACRTAGGGAATGPGSGRRRWRAAVLLTAVATAVVAPPILHNSLLAGRLAGPSANGGVNLYIGNGPQANGLFVTLAGFDLEEDPAGAAFLSRRLGRPVAGPEEADRIWADLAWREVGEHPLRAVLLWLRKVRLHFVAWEIPQVTPLPFWPVLSPPLRPLVVPYGLLAAGGLTGLALAGWRDRRWRIWSLALAVLVASQSLFFVVSRYRLVLVPALALLTAGAVDRLARLRGRRLLAGAAVALAAAVAVQPWGLGQERSLWRAMSLANAAVRWEHLGGERDLERAESLYRRAVASDPGPPLVWRNLARTQAREGDRVGAEATLEAGIGQARPAWPLERDLIGLLLEQGRLDEALARLGPYLARQPGDREMLHNQVVALARTGQTEAAVAAARRLIEAAPEDPQAYLDLGVLLARSGRPEEAARVFGRGLREDPGNAELRRNLELLDREKGAEGPEGPVAPGAGPP